MLALADVAIVVSDAKASARWWRKVLGFSNHTIGGKGHAVLVAPPGERLVLHLCEGFAPLEPGDTGIAFVTDDMATLVARMSKHGVRFPEPPRKEPWGSMAKFEDPDRNVFWLLEVPTSMVRSTLRLRAPTLPPNARRSRSPRPSRRVARK
ncbi:glyoxalase/bleomycin resistance protein/dioxygenase [mine drainage metagenome]|uniref:Glyoxalase/bleomycin resistance protein/dioxygenase n=1 Tax=mine drainage metagenome TaxID=410659 RepID=T1C8Q6_9ZZZZ